MLIWQLLTKWLPNVIKNFMNYREDWHSGEIWRKLKYLTTMMTEANLLYQLRSASMRLRDYFGWCVPLFKARDDVDIYLILGRSVVNDGVRGL